MIPVHAGLDHDAGRFLDLGEERIQRIAVVCQFPLTLNDSVGIHLCKEGILFVSIKPDVLHGRPSSHWVEIGPSSNGFRSLEGTAFSLHHLYHPSAAGSRVQSRAVCRSTPNWPEALCGAALRRALQSRTVR